MLATVEMLAFGAVLGPEMPVIGSGPRSGRGAPRRAPWGAGGSRPSHRGRVLGDLGTVPGPLVAGMLLVESGLSAASRPDPVLPPGLVAAAIGDAIFVAFGSWQFEAPWI